MNEDMNEKNSEQAEYMHADSGIIEKVNETMPDEEILYDLAELFQDIRRQHPHKNTVCAF